MAVKAAASHCPDHAFGGCCCFAENFQIADDGVLYQFLMQERGLVSPRTAVDPLNAFTMRQVVKQALAVLAHTSIACARTVPGRFRVAPLVSAH